MNNLARYLTPLFLAVAIYAHAQYATTVNDSSTTPAAPVGALNVIPQNDSGTPSVNVSHYAKYPTLQANCTLHTDIGQAVTAVMAICSNTTGCIIDARSCYNRNAWTETVDFNLSNMTLLLPCTSINTIYQQFVTAGTRNVNIVGCAYQGSNPSTGLTGGTVWNFHTSGTAWTVGDSSFAADTPGFSMSNMEVTTAQTDAASNAIAFDRVQEINLQNLYLLGNNSGNQTGITLNGTGNYAAGYFANLHISGYETSLILTGNSTGAANASTFTKLHINCSNVSLTPSANSIGIDLAYGDGNTVVGGDVEDCANMLHLGSGATSNTVAGLRWENDTAEIVADAGSQYNLLLTGSTIHTGKLTDNGTHNTFWDAFHHGVNNLNGDMWRSQANATVTNHVYTGIGLGYVRGVQDEYVTDVPGTAGSYHNAWLWGPGDGTTGVQLWSLQDLLNNVQRFGVQQNTTASGNNQTFLNGAGTGNVCFQCSTNAGTGGVAIGSGGSSPTTVDSFDATGNQTNLGYLRFFGSGSEAWRFNCASAEACALDDWTTSSSLHRLRFFANAGTDIDSLGTSAVTVNNTSTAGTGGFTVYGGGTNYATKLFSVTQTSGAGVYLLPGIASASGYNCAQVDTSGYVTNTGAACFNSTMSITGNAATATTTTGNAATASALLSTPTLCSTGYAPIGVLTSGNATGCAPTGTAHWSTGQSYLPTAATDYIGSVSLATNPEKDPYIIPRAGTVQSCSASLSAAQSASNYYTLYLYKNGSICSGLTLIMNSTAAYTPTNDNTHTCTVAQGDLLAWQAYLNGTPTTAMASVSCLY